MPAAPPSSPVPPTDRQRALAQYRQRAGRYDWELAAFEPLRRDAVAALQLRPGQTVIDVGCGTGLSFPLLQEAVGGEGRIVGVEQCPEMIALAQRRARTLSQGGGPTVDLVCAPAEDFRIEGRAHAAIFHFTHDVLRLPAAIEAVIGHLHPGARVVSVGLKWADLWLWPTNLFVWSAAMYSVTSMQGLGAPWDLLAQRLVDVEVRSTMFGGAYLARGTVPAAARE